MEILIIGGSRFVGKHVVEVALARDHDVTLFNRGTIEPPEGVARHIRGDRNEDLSGLEGGRWDAVLDTCGYVPRQVRSAAAALEGRVGLYAFVSTISVYRDKDVPMQDETAPVIELDDPDVEEVIGETYGGLKVLCERELERARPDASLVVRPGLIVGPDDPTDRFTYWPVRVARGGAFLAPPSPSMPVQWIDVRDLAAWLVASLEAGLTGTFNAVSETDRFTMGDLLATAARVAGSDAKPVRPSEAFLLEQGVAPFVELPLWIPGDAIAFSRIDDRRAHERGLAVRDAADTVRATLDWFTSTQDDRPLRAGLDPERERELLRAWEASGPHPGTAEAGAGAES